MNRRFLYLFFFVWISYPAVSHPNSVSYSTIEFRDKEIRIELRYTLLCTLELFQADSDNDQKLTEEELEAIKPLMFYYLNNKIKVLSHSRQLRLAIRKMRFSIEEDDSYVIMELAYLSPDTLESAIIFCNLSEEVDAYHRNLSQIKIGEKEYLFVFTNTNYFNSVDPPKALPASRTDLPSATPER